MKPAAPDQRAERSPARDEGKSGAELPALGSPGWEAIWERQNLSTALKRVESNRGAPGVDGMRVEALRPYLKEHWTEVREVLESGRYRPSPVRRVEIPKSGSGVRELGIPTVLDRLLQQAVAQALTPLFEPQFSPHSYGFRPGRSAHDAVRQAQEYVQEGYDWVVDIDLEKFFDRVNHDMLIARVVKDKRVLPVLAVRPGKLIRAYLESGVMIQGVVVTTEVGTPQGGPLSPLLANILLDDLDRELEKREHEFVRYADDCNIYVRSQRAGERVMKSVRRFLEQKLKLKVNRKKSRVEKAHRVKFLGFSFYWHRGEVRIRVDQQALKRFRAKMRRLTKRTRPGKLEDLIPEINTYLMGWIAYYRLADTPSVFDKLDGRLRRRLRQLVCLSWPTGQGKRWKRGTTRYRKLVSLGVPRERAALGTLGKSPWHMARTPVVNEALDNAYWRNQGLMSIVERYRVLRYA